MSKHIRGNSPLKGSTVLVGDNFNQSLKKFKKKVEKNGVISDFLSHRFYEKPSVTKREAQKNARSRWLKKKRILDDF